MAKKETAGSITKADAIRATLDAGIEKPKLASAHIKEQYSLDVSPQAFSTAKSVANKKAGLPASRRGRPRVAESGNGKANPAELARAIKQLVLQFGAEAVKGMADVFAE